MELLQLRYFKLTAESQQITRTASKLNISQSSLSKTIKSLETELGVPLFRREGRSIRLNENGQEFLKYVNQALEALESGKKALIDRNQIDYPDLILHVQAGISALPNLIGGFMKKYPGIHVIISKKQYCEFDKAKRSCDLTISLPMTDAVNDKFSITIFEEDMMMAFSKNHWAAGYSNIALSQLRNERFISFTKAAVYRYDTERFCQKAGFAPDIALECYDWVTLCRFVEIGMGIAFVPQYTWSDYANNRLALVPISSPHCTRRINLSWSDGGYLSESALLFRDYAIEYIESYVKNKII